MGLCSRELCTGCGACASICPAGSISFVMDAEGFRAPVIDQNQCVSCGKCAEICPGLNPVALNNLPQDKTYVCWNKNKNVVKSSSSGGVFGAIAEYVLSSGGVVYGCTMGETASVFHTRVDCLADLKQLHGSKYVQSDMRNTYSEAKADLSKGKAVFFTGCPCEIAGLYAFLGAREVPNLVTADLVCHGAGSPAFFQQYVVELGAAYNDRVINIEFRNKERKSYSYLTKIVFRGHPPIFRNAYDDDYMNCFLRGAIYREVCYRCQYAHPERIGDFTLGDFAGVHPKAIPNAVYKNGVSMLMINNAHADECFKGFSENICFLQRPLREATNTNLNLLRPSVRPTYRDALLQDTAKSIHERAVRYCKGTWKTKAGAILRKTKHYRLLQVKEQ